MNSDILYSIYIFFFHLKNMLIVITNMTRTAYWYRTMEDYRIQVLLLFLHCSQQIYHFMWSWLSKIYDRKEKWYFLREFLFFLFCRLELKGKYVLGDFLEFKGKDEDVEDLREIKRSKVSQMTIQKTSMLGFGNL